MILIFGTSPQINKDRLPLSWHQIQKHVTICDVDKSSTNPMAIPKVDVT